MVKYDEYFIKLPNNIIWTYTDGEISVVKYINKKAVTILSNLMFKCNPIGVCCFTLEDLIIKCGYMPKTGKGKINDQFKDVLIQLQELGFIVEPNVDMNSIKPNTFIECKIDAHIPNEDDRDIGFFRLFYKDYIRIMNLETDKDKSIILNSYCYISARVKHRPDDYKSVNEDKYRNEGKSEYTYFKYEDAISDLGITKATLKESLDILSDNELISYGNIGLVKKNGVVNVANNVYVIDTKEFESAINDSKFYYTNNGYSVIGKKSDDVTKKIIGLSSRIKQLESTGCNVDDIKKELKKVENKKNGDKLREKCIS